MKKYFIKFTIFLFVFTLFSPLFSENGQNYPSSEHFIAEFPAENAKLAQFFLDAAESARDYIIKRAGSPLDVRIHLVYCKTQDEFLRRTSMNPEHIIAAASPGRQTIYINGEQMKTMDRNETASVLVHEYAHVYLGIKAQDTLPRWLDEGLAMHLAGEWGLSRSLRLTTAYVFGNLIPLSRLEGSFPTQEPSLGMAYLQSYSLTSFIIDKYYDGEIESLIGSISHPSRGQRNIQRFWNPMIADSLENQWKKSFGGWFRNLLVVLVSSSFLWFGMTTLFIWAYLKKRKQAKKQMEIWEEEGEYWQ